VLIASYLAEIWVLTVLATNFPPRFLRFPSGWIPYSTPFVNIIEDRVGEWLNGREPGCYTFSQGVQFAADLYYPPYVALESPFHLAGYTAFLGILQDIFMSDESLSVGNNTILGYYGMLAPVRKKLPEWVTDHVEQNSETWFVHPNDAELHRGTPPHLKPIITGRRDHFLANASFTPLVSGIVQSLVPEDSISDEQSNAFGVEFGFGLRTSTISVRELDWWIQSRMCK
jgi:hypothetical protein